MTDRRPKQPANQLTDQPTNDGYEGSYTEVSLSKKKYWVMMTKYIVSKDAAYL